MILIITDYINSILALIFNITLINYMYNIYFNKFIHITYSYVRYVNYVII